MRRTSWGASSAQPAPPSSGKRRSVVECPLPPLVRLPCLYLLLVSIHSGCFVYRHGGGVFFLLGSLPLGALLGLLLDFFGRAVSLARARLLRQMRPLQTGFLLFFVYLIGYTLIFSLVVSLPLEWWLRVGFGSPGLAQLYVLFSANFIIALAVLSWIFAAVGGYRCRKDQQAP